MTRLRPEWCKRIRAVFGSTRPGSALAPDGLTISNVAYIVTRGA